MSEYYLALGGSPFGIFMFHIFIYAFFVVFFFFFFFLIAGVLLLDFVRLFLFAVYVLVTTRGVSIYYFLCSYLVFIFKDSSLARCCLWLLYSVTILGSRTIVLRGTCSRVVLRDALVQSRSVCCGIICIPFSTVN